MFKNIKGKRYDTDSAKLVGVVEGEEIYRKQTGEFFSYFSGKIKPLTTEAAKEFIKDNLPDEYDKYFNRTDHLVQTSVRIPAPLHDKLQREALRRGISLRVLIIEILTLYKTGDPR